MASNSLHSVSLSPLSTRPSYVPGEENDPDDEFDVLCVGDPFKYVIPSFDLLAVEIRKILITGLSNGAVVYYNVFVCNLPSLIHSLPARMTVKDFTFIQVSRSLAQ